MADPEDNLDDNPPGDPPGDPPPPKDPPEDDDPPGDPPEDDPPGDPPKDPPADDDPPKDPPKEGDEISYEKFTLPKGFKLEGERLDSFKEFSNDLGFDQGEAQKVVDYFTKMQTGEMQALEDRLAQRAKDDIATVYGWKSLQAGDGIEANVGLANTGIARLQDVINNIFGDDAISLFEHLKSRGLDTDPGITQMAYAHATTVSEDVLVKERGSPIEKKDRQDVLYPPVEKTG